MNDPKNTNSSTPGGPEDDVRNPNDTITPEQAQAEGLPEQKHAGAVGYGPQFAAKNAPTVAEKFTGMKEELVGKLTRNPEMEQKGVDRRTGALKRRDQAEDGPDPFTKQQNPEVSPTEGHGLTTDTSHPASQGEGAQPYSRVTLYQS